MNLLEQLVRDSRKLRPATKENYLAAVHSFVKSAGNVPTGWTPMAVEKWAKQMGATMAPQSVNTHLYAIKFVSRRYAQLYQTHDFAKPVEAFNVTDTIRPQRGLPRAAVAQLLRACVDGTPTGTRDRAIFLLGLRGGLRCSEIARVKWDDIKGRKLTVVGKGGQTEVIELDNATLFTIAEWKKMSNAPCPHMFIRTNPKLQSPCVPITRFGIYQIVKTRGAMAGVELTPHTLRHTCASLMIAAAVPLWRISKALRHRTIASIAGAEIPSATTMGYIHDIQAEGGDPAGEALGNLDQED